MWREPSASRRELKRETWSAGLVIVGGGLAGLCCAITAARAGVRVVLLQDRPVLGGNASSEIRLWILGATSHMANNNRWAREGGVVDEILVENLYRNPEGNPVILDSILLEKATLEPNLTLLLNTAVYDLAKTDADTIRAVHAYCSQNETFYDVEAPLFCDASGDGVVSFLAGAAFRVGAEGRQEFGEAFAPPAPTRELLGHSIYFYSKDTGRPVTFVPPSFALQDITQIPRWRHIRTGTQGCRFWWLEWGGTQDTIHETESIKWELWRIVYGVWNHIKNSGRFPDAANLTLEWVGLIPGKRESRRFEGDYMLTQADIVEQRPQADAVSYGGWAIDLHPVEGVYSPQPGATQWHSRGIYPIPYRCLYSRNVRNLFLAGRLISASHIAFGSTRVMATGAHNAQVVGMAAALALRDGVMPAAVPVGELQQRLLGVGQFIPGVPLRDPADLARTATLRASSILRLAELPAGEGRLPLVQPWAMLLPVAPGRWPMVSVCLDVTAATALHATLRVAHRPDGYTPDATLGEVTVPLPAGLAQWVPLVFDVAIDEPRYVFLGLDANPQVSVHLSDARVTGILALTHQSHGGMGRQARQDPPAELGLDAFEFWVPERRPAGKNLALRLDPPLEAFGLANVVNGTARPTCQPNAWVAAFEDAAPVVTLEWADPQRIGRVELAFDTDFDHALESVLMGHPERVLPGCIQHYRIRDDAGNVCHTCVDNHQTRNSVRLNPPVCTRRLAIEVLATHGKSPAALFEVRCYAEAGGA